MPLRINQSPWSKKVHSWSTKTLNAFVCKLTGDNRGYVTSWDHCMEAAIKLDVIKHPRYFARGSTGDWTVRDQMVQTSVATGPTGPIAICRAIAIIVGGKGKYYSGEQVDENSGRSGWRGSGLCGGSVPEVRSKKPVHRSRIAKG